MISMGAVRCPGAHKRHLIAVLSALFYAETAGFFKAAVKE